jgi:hypothetical protein
MSNVETLVRDYVEHIDSLSVPVDLDALVDSPTKPSVRGPNTRLSFKRGVAVGFAAFAVVLAVGAIATLGPFTPAFDTAATPPVVVGSSLDWSRVPHDDAVFSGRSEVLNDDVVVLELSMSHVVVGGPGLVAVGKEEWPDFGGSSALVAPQTAVVWTSVDGTTWTRVPDNDAVFVGAEVGGVIAGGPGLIAVGSLNEAVVWTSPDGIAWSQVPHDEAVFGSAGMNSVTPFGSGFVAVGGTGTGKIRSGNAVAWTSADGMTWTRAPHIDKTTAGSTGQEGMSQVVAGSAGSLVAIGWEWSDREEPFSPPIWNSSDGITWSRVSDDEAVFGGGGIAVVFSGGPGFIGVGSVGADAAVWTSPDGITWSRVPHDETVFRGAGITSVTKGGPGFIAVGWAGLDAAAWTSPDGVTWSRVPHDETIFGGQPEDEISSVVAFGSKIVAVGASGEAEVRRDAAVWIATVED